MRKVAVSLYLMPARNPKAQPYRSNWKMTAAEASAVGALYPIAGTTEMRNVPETDAERAQALAGYPSVGRDGVLST